jgi:hypothetical protein
MAKGLRLTLGGAPAVPHVVAGVPGLFRPDVGTPVGGDGEIPLDEAERLAADESIPLELVDLENEQRARDQQAADLEAARAGIAAAVGGDPQGSEPARIAAEVQAVRTTEPAAAGSETEG